MPKILNYPLASFEKSTELAYAVDALGGSCNVETCAQKLGKKVSGAFMVIISSAQKFGLVDAEKGSIKVTEDFNLIKHAYTEEEKNSLLIKAFMTPSVYSTLYDRFKGRELPVKLLDKIMIRELSVDQNVAQRIAGYFVDGLKELNLIDSNNVILSGAIAIDKTDSKSDEEKEVIKEIQRTGEVEVKDIKQEDGFVIHIYGPGLNNKIKIADEEDLLIVEATLKKVRKALKGGDSQN